jgi:hypothetical protein
MHAMNTWPAHGGSLSFWLPPVEERESKKHDVDPARVAAQRHMRPCVHVTTRPGYRR